MFKKVIASGIIAGSLAGGLALAAPAGASPYPQAEEHVCEALDAAPNEAGVIAVVAVGVQLVREGKTTSSAYAGMVVDAVKNRCPEYTDLVARTANKYSD